MALSIFMSVHYAHCCVYDVKLHRVNLYIFPDILKGFFEGVLVTQSHIGNALSIKEFLPSWVKLSD